MRASGLQNLESRGATPQLTVIKHKLRDWIESRIATLSANDDVGALERQLNAELKQAKVVCGFQEPDKLPCQDWTELGFIGKVALKPGSFLVVTAAVGIQCGYDESAYAYEWSTDGWRRFWQSEQDDYAEGKHHPQYIDSVQIAPSDHDRLVLTLGQEPWCASTWHDVYYRVWQTNSTAPSLQLLLDESEWAKVDAPIEGSVGSDDVLIEYSVGGIDVGFLRRKIRHYLRKEGTLQRVDPIALSPRDFADEWIQSPWSEVSLWTDATARARLEKWHQTHSASGEFTGTTLHCERRPDQWQVGISLYQGDTRYFLIRWRPPYRFTMVAVSDHPWPGCTEEDPEADKPRTLFLK